MRGLRQQGDVTGGRRTAKIVGWIRVDADHVHLDLEVLFGTQQDCRSDSASDLHHAARALGGNETIKKL